jgi:hypothetical protein
MAMRWPYLGAGVPRDLEANEPEHKLGEESADDIVLGSFQRFGHCHDYAWPPRGILFSMKVAAKKQPRPSAMVATVYPIVAPAGHTLYAVEA